MPIDALALALGAAVVHAAWNAGLAGTLDPRGATAVALLAGGLVCAPFALAFGGVSAEAAPYLAASVVAEIAYVALLATAYSRAEMSVVYPVARGTAPVLVLLAGIGHATAAQLCGVLLVAGGVLAVRGVGRTGAADVALALAVAATIATYTVIDKHGLEHGDPVPYLEIELLGAGLGYAALLGPRSLRGVLGWRPAITGVGMYAGYGLTLAALQLAPAASVAAVRETSVVFAVAIAATWLRERVTPVRFAGAVVVAAGVALLAV